MTWIWTVWTEINFQNYSESSLGSETAAFASDSFIFSFASFFVFSPLLFFDTLPSFAFFLSFFFSFCFFGAETQKRAIRKKPEINKNYRHWFSRQSWRVTAPTFDCPDHRRVFLRLFKNSLHISKFPKKPLAANSRACLPERRNLSMKGVKNSSLKFCERWIKTPISWRKTWSDNMSRQFRPNSGKTAWYDARSGKSANWSRSNWPEKRPKFKDDLKKIVKYKCKILKRLSYLASKWFASTTAQIRPRQSKTQSTLAYAAPWQFRCSVLRLLVALRKFW